MNDMKWWTLKISEIFYNLSIPVIENLLERHCQQRYVKILDLYNKDASLSIEAHDIDNDELKVIDVAGKWKLKLWH